MTPSPPCHLSCASVTSLGFSQTVSRPESCRAEPSHNYREEGLGAGDRWSLPLPTPGSFGCRRHEDTREDAAAAAAEFLTINTETQEQSSCLKKDQCSVPHWMWPDHAGPWSSNSGHKGYLGAVNAKVLCPPLL